VIRFARSAWFVVGCAGLVLAAPALVVILVWYLGDGLFDRRAGA
jgi:hypothetical protein